MRQITTHPSIDFSPIVSPNGQWIAFVTERSGNLDIWIRSVQGKTMQVTTHQADDMHPAWSPDGKRLAFVSKRRDAQGDIWTVAIDPKKGRAKGDPKQITEYLGVDLFPTFSSDGKSIIFSSDRDGLMNLWKIPLSTKIPEQLTLLGGTDPCHASASDWIVFTSYRAHTGGDLYLMKASDPEGFGDFITKTFPITWGTSLDGEAAWSPDSRHIVFVRRDQDTNGDHQVDLEDHGQIWQKRVFNADTLDPREIVIGRDEIQLTTNVQNDIDPSWSNSNQVYYASLRESGLDIWRMNAGGLFQPAENGAIQYAEAMDYMGESITEDALQQSLLGYQRVEDFFPQDSVWIARSLIQQAEIHLILGGKDKAVETFSRIAKDFESQSREAAQADLKLATFESIPVEDRIQRCQHIIERFPNEPTVVAEAWIVLGNLYKQLKDYQNSLSAYGQVIQSDLRYSNLKAQALLSVGEVLALVGQSETARQTYLNVLREYGQIPLWRERASERLLAQAEGNTTERIRHFQEIIQQADDLPSLKAKAQLAIGRTLMESGLIDQAIREFGIVEQVAPEMLWAHAEAKIYLAEIYSIKGDALKGILLLEELIQTYAMVEGGGYVQRARALLFDQLYESAETLKNQNDFSLSEARFRQALGIRPDDIRVHWGLIESAYRQGHILNIVEEYQTRIHENPNDPIILAALGLAYSYAGESNPKTLEQSNTLLLQALDEDYTLIYPYRTLSYNYELMERMAEEEAAKKPPFLTRVGRGIIAPFKWLVGLLPFKKEEKQEAYYEQAIQALMTALELNDENQDPLMEALLAQNLANNFYNLGEYGFRNAFRYYRHRLSLDSNFVNSLQRAVFFERVGHCGLVIEDREEAASFLREAIQIYTDLGRNTAALRNMKRLAFYYQITEDYENAIETYATAIEIDERANRWDEVQRGYRNIAYNYHLMGEPEEALSFAQKAESILKQWDLPLEEDKKSALRVEFLGLSIPVWGMEEIGGASAEGFTLADEAAFTYSLISRNAEILKQFPLAVQYEEKRLLIFQSRKDKLAERISLNRLGRLYYKQSQFDQAWNYFYHSWELNKKRKDIRGRYVNAVNLGNVATVTLSFSKNQDYVQQAILCLEEELSQMDAENVTFSDRDRLVLYTNLGTLYALRAKETSPAQTGESVIRHAIQRLKELQTAQAHFIDAIQIAQKNDMQREQGVLLKNLAEIAEDLGENDAAYELLSQAFDILEKGGEDDLLWRVKYGMAKLSLTALADSLPSTEREDLAISLYRDAMDLLEVIPVREEGAEERLSGRGERRSLYIDAASMLVSQGYPAEALETLERGHQRALADIVARRPPLFKRERHKIAWGNLRYLQNRLHEIRRKILQLPDDAPGRKRLKELEKQKDQYLAEYGDWQNKIRDEDALLAFLSGVYPFNVDEMQAKLRADEAVVGYLIASDGLTIWSLTDTDLTWTPVDAHTDTVANQIGSLNISLQSDTMDVSILRSLFDLLVRPVQSYLNDKTHITFIPNQFIWDIPFAALMDDEAHVIDRWTVTVSPSLTAQFLAWQLRKINQDTGFFLGDKLDRPIAKSMENSFDQQTIRLDKNATESAFYETGVSVDIIHLERWTQHQEHDPLLSAMILTPDQENDGYLHVYDLFARDIQASLVSIPSTLKGRQRGTQSLQGFIYALLYAGVPTVQLQQWPVDRKIKQIFYQNLYENIKTLSLAEALAEAQLAIRTEYTHPKYWAGFQLAGFRGMDRDTKVLFARENLNATLGKGWAYEQREEFVDAAVWYEKAKDMALAMNNINFARRIEGLVLRVSEKGQLWGKAVSYQKYMIEVAKEDGRWDDVRSSLNHLVTLYINNGQFIQAADTKSELIQMIEPVSEVRASHYEELAFIYALDRNYLDAVSVCDSASHIYHLLDDSLGQAKMAIRTGRFLLEDEAYWQARDALTSGIHRLEVSPEVESRDSVSLKELASGYQLLGLAYEKLTLYEEARKEQEKGLRLFHELKMEIQVGQAHQYLANLFWAQGDFRQSLVSQQKALEIFEGSNARKQLAMAQNTFGLIYAGLGDLKRAASSLEEALSIAKVIDSPADEATILKNLGFLAQREHDFARASQMFQKAARLDSTLGLKWGLAYDFRHLGMMMIRSNDFDGGAHLLRKGLTIARDIGDSRNAAQCLLGLGEAYHEMGSPAHALASLDSALIIANRFAIPDIQWRILRHRAKVWLEENEKIDALSDLKAAIRIVENLRAELKVETFKQGFLDDKMMLYTDIVHLLIEMDRDGEAFDYVERAKSRNFIDLLGNQDIGFGQVKADQITKEREARLAVQEARERIVHLEKVPTLSDSLKNQLEYWQRERETRRRIYQDLMTALQVEDPELASLVSVDPWRVDEIQALLPDSTLLVEYYLTPDVIHLWTLRSDELNHHEIAVQSDQLTDMIRRLRQTIQTHITVDIESRQLYDWLIDPLGDLIETVNHIIFVPHKGLHYLPFAALQNREGQSLIETHTLSIVPSATVLGYCIEKGVEQASQLGNRSVLAMSNPDLGDAQYALPFAEKEVKSLRRSFRTVTVENGPSVTEAAVREYAPSHSILHFACHGVFEPASPLFSALLLTPEGEDDGRLEAHEIFGLELDCDLVTLSACETGLAQITEGDELIGLSRSFIFAGTSSIITSLWKVDDLATAVMVKRFYRYLKMGLSKAEALRRAQLIVKNSVNSHPAAWAAFQLTGEYR